MSTTGSSMARIFISFRKSDERRIRNRVYKALTRRFGASRFFRSGDSIPLGADFAQVLMGQARDCEVMLVLIGSRWLDASDETGRRLLDRDDDWVRREIATSISAGNRVVPVLLGDSTMLPGPSQLPPDIARIGRLQFLRVTETRLDAALDDLVASIALLLPDLRTSAALDHHPRLARSPYEIITALNLTPEDDQGPGHPELT